MLKGQKSTLILENKGSGIVRLCEDTVMCSYSIGLKTEKGIHVKYISKELHDLLIEELGRQDGIQIR